MVHADLNPRLVVKTVPNGLDLTFYGATLGNTAGIEGATTEVELVAAINAVQSPTGAIRLQLPKEEGTHLVQVETLSHPALTA